MAIPAYGIGRHFHGVTLDEHTVISAFDFHRVRNYLAAARLGELLR